MTAPARPRVLVAEDSPTQAESLRDLLASHEFAPSVAPSGEAALAALAREPYELVLSDVLMPGIDGYELCRRIRALPGLAGLPVVLLTTLAEPLDVARGLAAGVTNYVAKPYQADILVARLRGALAKPHLPPPEAPAAVFRLLGSSFSVAASPQQILDVLASSLEDLVRANHRLQRSDEERAAQLVREHDLRLAAERAAAEKARALARLETSEARFRGLAASNLLGIAAGDARRITDANSAFLSLVGYRAEDVAAGWLDWHRLTPPEYADRDARARSELGERGSCAPYEKELIRADGSRIPVLLGAALVTREPLEWACFVLDMSARRRAEEQLRHAQRIQAIGTLAGGVAHEVNNMMTVVIGVGDFVLRALAGGPSEGAEVRPDVRQMVGAAQRAAGISQQLLAFTRQQVFRLQMLDLSRVVRDAVPMLERLLGDHRAIETRLPDGVGAIRSDASQLQQVLVNLALNARDAMADGGQLRVETSVTELDSEYARTHAGVEVRPGSYAQLSVSDTGRGMSRETLDRVFEPFFTTKPVGQGTGLGLSTVYGIVKQNEGYVWLYSEPGLGTTVKIYLPVVPAASENDPVPAPAPDPVPLGAGEPVLVVEDEAVVRHIARRTLEELGYDVHEAAGGRAALDLIQELPRGIGLVLCDVVMPGMSGTELGDALKASSPRTPVLFMSGYTGDEVVRRGLLRPGQPFLQKPFSREGLARAVRTELDRVGT